MNSSDKVKGDRVPSLVQRCAKIARQEQILGDRELPLVQVQNNGVGNVLSQTQVMKGHGSTPKYFKQVWVSFSR